MGPHFLHCFSIPVFSVLTFPCQGECPKSSLAVCTAWMGEGDSERLPRPLPLAVWVIESLVDGIGCVLRRGTSLDPLWVMKPSFILPDQMIKYCWFGLRLQDLSRWGQWLYQKAKHLAKIPKAGSSKGLNLEPAPGRGLGGVQCSSVHRVGVGGGLPNCYWCLTAVGNDPELPIIPSPPWTNVETEARKVSCLSRDPSQKQQRQAQHAGLSTPARLVPCPLAQNDPSIAYWLDHQLPQIDPGSVCT